MIVHKFTTWNTRATDQRIAELEAENVALREVAGRASKRLRAESDWVLRNDLDMKFREDCPDGDPIDLADEIDTLLSQQETDNAE